jgi:hypothetical protein
MACIARFPVVGYQTQSRNLASNCPELGGWRRAKNSGNGVRETHHHQHHHRAGREAR